MEAKALGKLVCGTTINYRLPKNWYYDEVRAAESGMNPDAHSVRVGIYQCPFYTDYRREKIVNKHRNDPDKLKCELLAEFPSVSEKYNLDEIVLTPDGEADEVTNAEGGYVLQEDVLDVGQGVIMYSYPSLKEGFYHKVEKTNSLL